MKYITSGILCVIILAACVGLRKKKTSGGDIFFVPSGVSEERVSKLGLLQEPPHDLGILKESEIRFPKRKEPVTDKNYRGQPEIEWIVDIHPPEDFRFKKDKFLEVFDYEWRTKFSSEFYAHFPISDEWSFAIAGGSPEEFDSLELAVQLADRFQEEKLSAVRLDSYLLELKRRLKKFGVDFEVVPRESSQQASVRSDRLKKFQTEVESELVVVLKADTNFESKDFWNVLVEVGLKWGDGDVFHWENYKSGFGDDQFFSVWTSTSPGYFFPEEVANNNFKPQDLIFGFSIPRSADPERVFEMMINAVEYCQRKLGGVVLDENGKAFEKGLYQNKVETTITQMREQGLDPGQGVALRIF